MCGKPLLNYNSGDFCVFGEYEPEERKFVSQVSGMRLLNLKKTLRKMHYEFLEKRSRAENRLIAGHEEERFHLKTFVLRAQPLGVVMLFEVDDLLRACHHVERKIIIAPVLQDDQPAVISFQN